MILPEFEYGEPYFCGRGVWILSNSGNNQTVDGYWCSLFLLFPLSGVTGAYLELSGTTLRGTRVADTAWIVDAGTGPCRHVVSLI